MKLYRTILAALLLISMLLPLASCATEPAEVTTEPEETKEVVTEETEEPVADSKLTEHKIEDIQDSLRLLGERTGFSGGEILAEWSGSGFEMNVDIAEGGSDLRIGFRCNYGARWKVYVDGEEYGERLVTSNGNKKYTAATAIPAGEHTIALVKDSQPATSRNNYNSILSVAFNGEFLTPPADKELYLEFIGDGYMVGFGALGNSSSSTASKIVDETSVTAALPYLTAKAMDADYSIVAHSSIGFETKAGAFRLPALYANRYAYRELDKLYKPDRKPDAIIIHAGMDDSETDLPMGEFIVTAKNYVETVRKYYKDQSIPVIWLYNTMYHTVRTGEIRALEEYMGPGSNVYAFECVYGANGSGSTETARHPSAEDHQKTVDILVPFLQQLLAK